MLIAIAATAMAACSSTQPVTHASQAAKPVVARAQQPTMAIGERAAAVALRQVGAPYRYGGTSPSGFDCSGLVHYSYANAGKSIPRTTAGLWSALAPVEADRVRVGDLLFFSISGKMSHVGMYVGNGRFVHAPSTGKVVSVERLGSEYYSRAFIRAGRPQ